MNAAAPTAAMVATAKIVLRIMKLSSVFIGCDLTSCPSVGRTICPFNGAPNLWISIDHLVMAITRERHLLAGADARGGDSSVRQELARAIKSPTSKSGAKLRECTREEVHTAVLTDYSTRAGTTLIGG